MASFSSPWADLALDLERASAPTSLDAASALLSALAALEAHAIDDDNVIEVFLSGLAHKLHAVIVGTLGAWKWDADGSTRRGAQRAAVAQLRRVVRAADDLAQYHDGLLELQAHDVLETLERLVLGPGWGHDGDARAERRRIPPPGEQLAETVLLMPAFRLFELVFAKARLSEDDAMDLSARAREHAGEAADENRNYGEIDFFGFAHVLRTVCPLVATERHETLRRSWDTPHR